MQNSIKVSLFERFIDDFEVSNFFKGFVPACIMEVFSYWAPPEEKSRLIVCGIFGVYVGAAISYPLCGFLAQLLNWESIFYVTGELFVYSKYVYNKKIQKLN